MENNYIHVGNATEELQKKWWRRQRGREMVYTNNSKGEEMEKRGKTEKEGENEEGEEQQ